MYGYAQLSGTLEGLEGARSVAGFLSSVIIVPASDHMIRTQVSLDEQEYAAAKAEASALGISVAEFVRRAIRVALPVDGNAPWMKFAGLVETGDSNSSQSIDEIVYGPKG